VVDHLEGVLSGASVADVQWLLDPLRLAADVSTIVLVAVGRAVGVSTRPPRHG
jgi:hypothetical protein